LLAGIPGKYYVFNIYVTLVARRKGFHGLCSLNSLFIDVETVPVRTVNRQCSSGLQAVADVAAAIKAGFYDIGSYDTLYAISTHSCFISSLRC
jgi:hypothetical protein